MNVWTTPTPEGVAEALADGIDSFHHGYDWEIDYERDGNVIAVTVTPQDVDTGVRLDRRQKRFRAVVVPADAGPVVVASPELLDAARALYRWHTAASTLDAEKFAALVYAVDDALAALTPEQVAVLAGDDEGGDGDA